MTEDKPQAPAAVAAIAQPGAGPLAGIKVLDMTTVLFGPYATMLLGDMGAAVVKLETLEGDSTRSTGPGRNPGMAGVFMNVNRNKRSIAVDLKRAAGKAIALELMADTDVFVTNVRRKAVERLGLGYAEVASTNPGIIYCNAVGYGAGGPYEDYPAFDDTIQAISGLASFQGIYAEKPQLVASAMADKACGLMLALAIVAAIRHRDVSGRGQQVEVPMFETMVSFNLVEHLFGRVFEPPLGDAVYPRVVSKFRRPYRSRDGYLMVLPYNDGQWQRFFGLIGKPALAADERFVSMAARTRNIDALYELLDDAIGARSNKEWLEGLRALDIPVVPVKSGAELVDDEHLRAVGFWRHETHPSEGEILSMQPPIRMSASPLGVSRPAPRLGGDSADILRDLGYDEAAVAALVAGGVLRVPGTGD